MDLREPPLGGEHDTSGAKTTEFGGWEMPVEFDSIRTEHAAVREAAGKFDVSHMGQIEVSGPDAAELLNRLTTNDVASLEPGEAQYAMITDTKGYILDDTVVYRLPAERDADFLFIPNAGHDEEMADRWVDHRDEWGLDATVENHTTDYAMIAVQGPDAADLVAGLADEKLVDLGSILGDRRDPRRRRVSGRAHGLHRRGRLRTPRTVGRCETVWEAFECQPCGLGARDTLRIEAGFLLSGSGFRPRGEPAKPLRSGRRASRSTSTPSSSAATRSRRPRRRVPRSDSWASNSTSAGSRGTATRSRADGETVGRSRAER